MSLKSVNTKMRSLPSVDKLLHETRLSGFIAIHGRQLVTHALRESLADSRQKLGKTKTALGIDGNAVIGNAIEIIKAIAEPSLKPVINATGIILHTNLGRAPMGETVFNEIAPIVNGYSNIEFDLKKARRGHRANHITGLLRYLTGAQDAIVVNNNAAAIVLALNTLACGREVVISRGELIEIGGAFRIPDIMAAAGVRMKEVGTTNRTRLSDYQKAVGPDTALIVKAHTSNYAISGFTEEVSVRDCAAFAHSKRLPFLYDIGSGLLRKPLGLPLKDEPDVRFAIAAGADLVCFSGDKLLGGPQAGIIAGKARLIKLLAQAPLMRALRVGKLTLAALAGACRLYLSDDALKAGNPIFSLLERNEDERNRLAHCLLAALESNGARGEIVESFGQCGGGTLPRLAIKSFAVSLQAPCGNVTRREAAWQNIFHGLLNSASPVLAVLREGRLLFDVFALRENELETIAKNVASCMRI